MELLLSSGPFLGMVLVGVVSGCLSGLLGVGGATISTPGVRLLGASPLQAVGSTIPAVIPSAVIGAWRHARAGMVDWRVALVCGGAGSAAAVAGALFSDLLDPRLLMVLTAVVLLWSGFTVLRGEPILDDGAIDPDAIEDDHTDDHPAHARPGVDVDVDDRWSSGSAVPVAASAGAVAAPLRPAAAVVVASTGLLVAVGVAAGVVAGLLGLGGGVVMMPLLTGLLRTPVKQAVGSSLVAVALFSVPALATHILLGHVAWSIALALMVGVVPGARLGSHLSLAASDRALRSLFGLFLVALAAVYGVTELGGLLAGR